MEIENIKLNSLVISFYIIILFRFTHITECCCSPFFFAAVEYFIM